MTYSLLSLLLTEGKFLLGELLTLNIGSFIFYKYKKDECDWSVRQIFAYIFLVCGSVHVWQRNWHFHRPTFLLLFHDCIFKFTHWLLYLRSVRMRHFEFGYELNEKITLSFSFSTWLFRLALLNTIAENFLHYFFTAITSA